MSTVDELFDRYRAAFQAGEGTDPGPYLEQLGGADRRELEALIEGFLARGARRRFDADAFARMRADPLAQRIQASVAADLEQSWQTVLPRARMQAKILRSDLVKRLASALGVGDREAKVAGYYHAMETGTLDPSGVSDRVLQALSAIVGVPAETLRAAGRRLSPPPSGAPTFARIASPAPRAAPEPAAAAPPPEWDEVDELFRGG